MDFIVLDPPLFPVFFGTPLLSHHEMHLPVLSSLLQERDVRIIVGSFDGEWAGRIFCQVSIILLQ